MTDQGDRSTVARTVGGVVLLLAIIAAAVIVFALRPGTDPSRLLSFLSGAILPAIPGLLAAARADRAVKKVDTVTETVANVATDVAEVKEQTNGTLHALVDQVMAATGNPLPSPDGDIQQQGSKGGSAGRHSSAGGR